MTFRFAALLTILLAPAAIAETAPAPPREIDNAPGGGAEKPTAAFGDDHPDCAEWTDRCIVCMRDADGPACSLPGIACVPAEANCLKKNERRREEQLR
jgi:hypothetical protein